MKVDSKCHLYHKCQLCEPRRVHFLAENGSQFVSFQSFVWYDRPHFHLRALFISGQCLFVHVQRIVYFQGFIFIDLFRFEKQEGKLMRRFRLQG